MSVRVLGIDLSLSSTGMAEADQGDIRTWTIKGTGTGHERLDELLYAVGKDVWKRDGTMTPFVVVEGPSYGSSASGQKGHHERAGLWWLLTHRLWDNNIPFAVVPPAALKKYATGAGNASKDKVLLAAARRFPDFDGGNDAADALWLAAMGADHLGSPCTTMPELNRAALNSVEWPTSGEAAS